MKKLINKKNHLIYEALHGFNIPILKDIKEIATLDMVENKAVVIMNDTAEKEITNTIKESTILELVSYMCLSLMHKIRLHLGKLRFCFINFR